MKIAVFGYSGSGKSTLAQYLGRHFAAPVLHLDRVHFGPGWRERPDEVARGETAAFMQQAQWVIDGNYTGLLQAERFAQADGLVFLNFGRFTCLGRALRRYFQNRGRTRASAAEGCPEKIDLEFIWWILYSGRTRQVRGHYRQVMEQYAEKAVELKDQRQLDAFMADPEGAFRRAKKGAKTPPL